MPLKLHNYLYIKWGLENWSISTGPSFMLTCTVPTTRIRRPVTGRNCVMQLHAKMNIPFLYGCPVELQNIGTIQNFGHVGNVASTFREVLHLRHFRFLPRHRRSLPNDTGGGGGKNHPGGGGTPTPLFCFPKKTGFFVFFFLLFLFEERGGGGVGQRGGGGGGEQNRPWVWGTPTPLIWFP